MQNAGKRALANQQSWTVSSLPPLGSGKGIAGRFTRHHRYAGVRKCRCEPLSAYCVCRRVNCRLFEQLSEVLFAQVSPRSLITHQFVRRVFSLMEEPFSLEGPAVHLCSASPLAILRLRRRVTTVSRETKRPQVITILRGGWPQSDSGRNVLQTLAGADVYARHEKQNSNDTVAFGHLLQDNCDGVVHGRI